MNSRIIRLLTHYKKYIISIIFVLVFVGTLIINIPTFVLANLINSYSQEKLALYNTRGTFWHGSGLLVAVDKKISQSAPLVMVNWGITLGMKKFIDIKFTIGDTLIADVYLNKHGANLDKLDLSLSISQVSRLFGLVHDLGLSGNINVNANAVHLGKVTDGVLNVNLTNVSSSLSPVNPLGTYLVNLDAHNGNISVSSSTGSALILSGDGNLKALNLNAKIDATKKAKMEQFITFMGIPLPDGSYTLKMF
jgi:hypothetical protein